jgi:peptide/nickel transport system permease protein/peptide/nickel transport system substrate-binding protein
MEDNAMSMKESLVPGATRREAMALISGALAGVALGGSAGAQSAPKRGGILRISAFTNPSSLDPTTGGAGSDHAFLFTMYDTLTEWDFDTLKPKPGLAESWSFTDPTTLVLNIRSGVTFHDGTALDAEAVKFNFERNKSDQKSNIKADLSTMASVEVTGPMQVTLKLNTPDAAMPGILSDRAGMMVSPTAVKSSGAGNVARTPVGAGAYAFVSWADGERIVVKRNEKYWKTDRPYPDGIEFAIIPELTTGVRSVTAGQNDLIYQLPPRQKAIVERSNNLKVVNGPTLYVFQIFLNWAKPPFDDVRVRKAPSRPT